MLVVVLVPVGDAVGGAGAGCDAVLGLAADGGVKGCLWGVCVRRGAMHV